jgi:Probable metallopeptidase family (DUF6775)
MTSSRRSDEIELRSINLYKPEYAEDIDINSIEEFLEQYFPTVDISVRPPVLSGVKGKELLEVADRLARARIKDPSRQIQTFEPMYGEVDFERRASQGKARVGGMVYDGLRLEDVYASVLADDTGLESANIIFTQRLITTFSRDDLRHHLRTVLCSFPSVVSIPGIVEAPAKPREFYLLKQELEASGAGGVVVEKLKASMNEMFVDYGDPRLNEALKGIALQALMFHLTLDPFCDKFDCRLFNAHWQQELIKSQITGGELCARHKKLLRKLREKPTVAW